MDVVCGVCGQRNPSHRRFCLACNRYLDATSQQVPSEDEEPAAAVDSPVHLSAGTEVDLDVAPSYPYVSAPLPTARYGSGVVTVPCPVCRTENRPNLRFCRKCGQFLADPVAASSVALPDTPRQGWWRRLVERWTLGGSNASRAAYRRSLPLRYRLMRWSFFGLLVVLAVAVPLLLKYGAVGWVRGLL